MVQRHTIDPFREWLSLQHCPSCGGRGRFRLGKARLATSNTPRTILVTCACGKTRLAKPTAPAMGATKVTMTPPTWLEE